MRLRIASSMRLCFRQSLKAFTLGSSQITHVFPALLPSSKATVAIAIACIYVSADTTLGLVMLADKRVPRLGARNQNCQRNDQ